MPADLRGAKLSPSFEPRRCRVKGCGTTRAPVRAKERVKLPSQTFLGECIIASTTSIEADGIMAVDSKGTDHREVDIPAGNVRVTYVQDG